jgi:hypothetical protein
MAHHPAAQQLAADAEESSTVRMLARAGYAVLGILHVIIGAIAISVATGAGSGEADQSGAMKQLAQAPLGLAALWAIAIGLFALGVWQIVQTVRVRVETGTKKWAKRLTEASKGLTYFVLCGTALIFALGGRTSSSHASKSASAALIATPGGVFLIVAISLVVIGIAIGFLVRGITRRFRDDIRVPEPPLGTAVVVLGSTGYIAKGVALAIVGILFGVAALTSDSDKAGGMNGALKILTLLPFGELLLWIVGAGLIAYGLYCFARAPLARL